MLAEGIRELTLPDGATLNSGLRSAAGNARVAMGEARAKGVGEDRTPVSVVRKSCIAGPLESPGVTSRAHDAPLRKPDQLWSYAIPLAIRGVTIARRRTELAL